MISAKKLFDQLIKNGINFFCGVPDSVLKNFTNYLSKKKKYTHLILSNEGSAISTGIGYFLKTKKLPVVYMQNSGLGNSLNPIISIAHKKVYKIPMLLLIGWRGSPNSKDEPQHLAQGKITQNILKLCGIKFCLLQEEKDFIKLNKLIAYSKKNNAIIACLVKNNVILKNNIFDYSNKKSSLNKNQITRSYFVEFFLKQIENIKNIKLISSTGYLSRELYSKLSKIKREINPFYMVGGMGHTSSVALGYSLNNKKQVICLDGDGSFLMHLGSNISIGKYARKNFKYVLLNNNLHESVGGQSTNIETMGVKDFSKSVGYKQYFRVSKKNKCEAVIKKFLKSKGPSFLEVITKINPKDNILPRPKHLFKVKEKFIRK